MEVGRRLLLVFVLLAALGLMAGTGVEGYKSDQGYGVMNKYDKDGNLIGQVLTEKSLWSRLYNYLFGFGEVENVIDEGEMVQVESSGGGEAGLRGGANKHRATQSSSSDYISLVFTNPESIPSATEEAFRTSVDLWNRVIRTQRPDVFVGRRSVSINEMCGDPLETDYIIPAQTNIGQLFIVAEVIPIDNVNGILGQAAPCRFVEFNGFLLPVIGFMQFDEADVNNLIDSGDFDRVVLHEIGHILGFGTLWTAQEPSLLKNPGTSDPEYIGSSGIAGYRQLQGTGNIDVANTGGAGTRDSHWRDNIFGSELMTGTLGTSPQPLSIMTILSLEDLGYEVDSSLAEDYVIPTLSGGTLPPSSDPYLPDVPDDNDPQVFDFDDIDGYDIALVAGILAGGILIFLLISAFVAYRKKGNRNAPPSHPRQTQQPQTSGGPSVVYGHTYPQAIQYPSTHTTQYVPPSAYSMPPPGPPSAQLHQTQTANQAYIPTAVPYNGGTNTNVTVQ